MMEDMDNTSSHFDADFDSQEPAYVPKKTSRLKTYVALGALVLFAGAAVVTGLFLKKTQLDDRSKAALSGVSYETVSERFEATGEQAFDVSMVNNQQPDGVRYSSFTAEVTLYPVTQGQVLGMSTQDEVGC